MTRLKLYLGLGPADAYLPLSKGRRQVLVVAQAVLIVGLFVARSWATRLGVVAVVVAFMVAVAASAPGLNNSGGSGQPGTGRQ